MFGFSSYAQDLINFAQRLCYSKKKLCLSGRLKERCDLRMHTPDIMIYKGEKETKYQLYIEDYVMSYLKNYGKMKRQGQIFFYGLREQEKRTYYIYGAASERQLVFFRKYALLEEILYRGREDMPVFAVQEGNGEYELSGYHIFYQSNEEMQGYMIEQRKALEQEEKSGQEQRDKLDLAIARKKQAKKELRNGSDRKSNKTERSEHTVHMETERTAAKQRSWLMAIQLSAVFILLTAIIINSTNSYGKLKELGQAAVEVFFTMENQDAVRENARQTGKGISESENAVSEMENVSGTTDADDSNAVVRDGGILYLTDFEEELALENGQDTESKETDAIGNDAESNTNTDDGTDSQNNMDKASDADGTNNGDSETDDTQTVDVIEEASAQAYGRTFAEYYQIEKGDTLYKISQKLYGDITRVEEICELNQISDPDNIKYGQKILLP